MALEPICFDSKGSSTSLRCWSRRRSQANFEARGRDAAEHLADAVLQLAGGRLAADGDGREAHLLAEALFQRLHLGAVALEQLQEAGLGARGALHAAHGRGADEVVQVLQVQEQILDPEGGPLAHGGGLGGLEVGEAQGGLVLPLRGKGGQGSDDVLEAAAQQSKGLLSDEQVPVVGDEAAGGAQVDDGPGAGGLLAPGVDGGHDVVAQGGFMLRDGLQVHGVLGGLQLRDLGLRHGQAQLGLGLRQGDPEPAPDPLR